MPEHRTRGVWAPRRNRRAGHPHYVGNNNESLRLDQVIAADPPDGGLEAYLAYLESSGLPPVAPLATPFDEED